MADNVSLDDLEADARIMADVQNETDRHPQAEVWKHANRGIKQFHNEVVRCQGQGLFQTDTFVTTVQGQEMYGLPAQLLAVKKVWTVMNGREIQFDGYEEAETHGLYDNASWDPIMGCAPMWRIVGDNISIRPTPEPSGMVINIRYIATAVQLEIGSDTVDAIEGFDDFIIAYMARRMAFKDNRQDIVAMCNADMAEIIERMRAVVRIRNASQPIRIPDKSPDPFSRHFGTTWRSWWPR